MLNLKAQPIDDVGRLEGDSKLTLARISGGTAEMSCPANPLRTYKQVIANRDELRPTEILVKFSLESYQEAGFLRVAEKEVLALSSRREIVNGLCSIPYGELELVLAGRSSLGRSVWRQFPDKEASSDLFARESVVADVGVEVLTLAGGRVIYNGRAALYEHPPYELPELGLLQLAAPGKLE